MKTRPLTIQIPKPDENGFCNDKCPIKEDFDDCLYSQKHIWKPGKGCPWYKYEGGEDE